MIRLFQERVAAMVDQRNERIGTSTVVTFTSYRKYNTLEPFFFWLLIVFALVLVVFCLGSAKDKDVINFPRCLYILYLHIYLYI